MARLGSILRGLRDRVPLFTHVDRLERQRTVWLNDSRSGAGRRENNMSTPDNQSYLAAGINKLSPWGPRSPASKSFQASDGEAPPAKGLSNQKTVDHRIGHRRGLSLRSYPRDCPPLAVQWFFAADIPKRKPLAGQVPSKLEKVQPVPKKYSSFSNHDSRAIETAFQKLSSKEDATERKRLSGYGGDLGLADSGDLGGGVPDPRNEGTAGGKQPTVKVPVNEDFLFDVDIGERELAPAYWLGPVYEVRRGTWFHQGSLRNPRVPRGVLT